MPAPKCMKCESTDFELQQITVTHSKYKLNAVVCSNCGSVQGVLEYFNIAARIDLLAKKLKIDLDS